MTKNVFEFDVLDTKTLAEAGYEVEVLGADSEPSGIFITVMGVDSSAYQKLRERFDRQRIRQLSKGGRNAIDSVYDNAKNQDFELVAECTISWRHETKDMPFEATDKERLQDFYKKYPLVYDQVRLAMNDRQNFTKGSEKA